jgi:hypothetical protein
MRVRRTVWVGVLAAAVLGTGAAHAVSSGGYDSKKQGCSGKADNEESPNRVEKNCRNLIFSISDAQHTYFSVGTPQVADHENPVSAVIACLDLGTGSKQCMRFSRDGVTPLPASKGTKADPSTGLHFYFGADDNLDSGEHDSSKYINNGPSDGGAIVANLSPAAAQTWLAKAMAADQSYLLTHPLPGFDAGFGACADGLCFSVTTQRRVAYQGGNKRAHRDVADYGGVTWDPETCSGADDTKKDCGGHSIAWWHEHNGTTYVEPGIQVYEDPDPQGSPIGPYPIPAFYVGTCGLIIGGANLQMPASPITNSAGQIVVPTGC